MLEIFISGFLGGCAAGGFIPADTERKIRRYKGVGVWRIIPGLNVFSVLVNSILNVLIKAVIFGAVMLISLKYFGVGRILDDERLYLVGGIFSGTICLKLLRYFYWLSKKADDDIY